MSGCTLNFNVLFIVSFVMKSIDLVHDVPSQTFGVVDGQWGIDLCRTVCLPHWVSWSGSDVSLPVHRARVWDCNYGPNTKRVLPTTIWTQPDYYQLPLRLFFPSVSEILDVFLLWYRWVCVPVFTGRWVSLLLVHTLFLTPYLPRRSLCLHAP